MEPEALARALAISSADSMLFMTSLALLISKHPARHEIVRSIDQFVAGQMVESARADHYEEFREELRTRWQQYRDLLDAFAAP